MTRFTPSLIALGLIIGVQPAAGAYLADVLNHELKGAWAVLEIEVYSGCSGTYSDNQIGPAGVASKAGRRFDPGEVVKIDKIKVKRARVDLLVTLSESILVSKQDGPFELFDERECQAQLIFSFPRAVIKGGDPDPVMVAIGASLTTHPSQNAARDSDDWSGRERQPYPPDYDQTLARYRVWQAEQTNAAITAGLERSIDEATSVADDIESDPEYLDGFSAGIDKMRSVEYDDCDDLIDETFNNRKRNPPSEKSTNWKEGFEDGQRLLYHLLRAEKLRTCYVPVPALFD